jgi:hypothetical protein
MGGWGGGGGGAVWVSRINTLRYFSVSADRKSEEQGLPESRLPEFSAEVLRSKKIIFLGWWVGFEK